MLQVTCLNGRQGPENYQLALEHADTLQISQPYKHYHQTDFHLLEGMYEVPYELNSMYLQFSNTSNHEEIKVKTRYLPGNVK